jgi:hypothetical protein
LGLATVAEVEVRQVRPRFPTMFECLTNASACQQPTLTVGIVLLNRLADAYGPTSPLNTKNLVAPAHGLDAPTPREASRGDDSAIGASSASGVEMACRVRLSGRRRRAGGGLR